MNILIPCSLGELYDKITILRIKLQHIKDEAKLKNVQKELDLLMEMAGKYPVDSGLYKSLMDINQYIWDIEDNIRIKEKNGDFNVGFVELARSVYFKNDRRAEIKREINEKYGSEIIEEKSYEKY